MTRPDPAALAVTTTVATALADPRTALPASASGRARPQSLAGGAVGIALLHIERERTGHGDAAATHAWLSRAASESVSAGSNANLFHGAPALGYVLHAATTNCGRYGRALAAIDEQTIAITRMRLAAAHARIDRGDRLVMREFDLIHGLTGLGVYHLGRHPEHPITRDVLAYLVRITQPLPLTSPASMMGDLPPWWMHAGLTGEPDPQYPNGHGNLGVAHGLSAVIALLSLALLKGMTVVGGRDAVAKLCAWTDQWRQHTDTGSWWPGYIAFDHNVKRHVDQTQRPRPSWCYGVAGIARAQQLAGLALADPDRQDAAETAMLAALRDPAQRALLPDIGLCHGKAGLLQAAWRMAADSGNHDLAGELPGLGAQLAAQLSGPISDPELLDGAAGAALALHTLATRAAPASGWDRFLLLS